MKRSFALFCGLGLALSGSWVLAASAGTCISTKSQFEQVKDQFPSSMQNFPAVFTANEGVGKGGVIVRQSGDGFRLQMKKVVLLTSVEDDQKVKSVCVQGSQMTVTLENKSVHLINVQGSNIVYERHTLVKTNMDTYNKLLNSSSGGMGIFGSPLTSR